MRNWANENESRVQKWKQELYDNDIDDMESLKNRAEGSRWRNTLLKLSDGLTTQLEKWFYANYHQRKKALYIG